MTQIITENINGEEYTVIRKPFDAEHVRQQSYPVVIEFLNDFSRTYDEYVIWYPHGLTVEDVPKGLKPAFIKVKLPPLPRYPDNSEETIRLLSLYRGHGIEVWIAYDDSMSLGNRRFHSTRIDDLFDYKNPEITDAKFNGAECAIALEG